MKIAITQRVDSHATYAERRDGLDQSWFKTVRDLFGPQVVLFPVPNDRQQISAFMKSLEPQGIILTGGNDLAATINGHNIDPERDAVESLLLTYAAPQDLSVLAVCRGFQFLNAHFGGQTVAIEGHVGTAHALYTDVGGNLQVNSFHTQAIQADNLASELAPIAWDEAGHIEAAYHRNLPWLGVMWHPERTRLMS